ncbi:MAG: protein TolR [bacterium]|nr:protein TolR [bacterium]
MKGTNKRYQQISEINVTPLVDVMLVLLIIFMVTAPMMQQGLSVDLPSAKGSPLSKEKRQIIVSITKDKKIAIGKGERTGIKELAAQLEGLKGRELLIKADSRVPYGFVIEVMAKLQSAGIENVGLITNPEEV